MNKLVLLGGVKEVIHGDVVVFFSVQVDNITLCNTRTVIGRYILLGSVVRYILNNGYKRVIGLGSVTVHI